MAAPENQNNIGFSSDAVAGKKKRTSMRAVVIARMKAPAVPRRLIAIVFGKCAMEKVGKL